MSLVPVAVKRHEFLEMDQWDDLIEIIRDPRDAVVSHMRKLTFEEFKERLPKQVELWLQHVERFENWDPDKRINIRYSDVTTSPDRVLLELEKFLNLTRVGSINLGDVSLTGYAALHRPSTSTRVSPSVQFPERANLVAEQLDRVRPLSDLATYF